MLEWQPIETAPRKQYAPDANLMLGRPEIIVGWRGHKHIALAYWVPDRGEDGCWISTGQWTLIGHPFGLPPTHWLPLPKEPPNA